MLIVHGISFGSLWWLRPGKTRAGEYDSRRSAIFNTTGFLPDAIQAWNKGGIVRFNSHEIRFNPADRDAFVGRNYQTVGLEEYNGTKRLLLTPVGRARPDVYLVAHKSVECGRICFASRWRTAGVRIVSASALYDGSQETLLLLREGDRIETSLGIWGVTWNKQNRAILSLTDALELPS